MSAPSAPRPAEQPLRDASRYGSAPHAAARPCPLCATPIRSLRARYCSAACKQRAYRTRRTAPDVPTPTTGSVLAPDRVARTIYACPDCGERYLGERRCPDCNRFCRRLGLGGHCPDCEQPILIAELLGKEALL
jgi:predicted RNA-binding Zn-ribbon protein involved in translation (DUF1610 family)